MRRGLRALLTETFRTETFRTETFRTEQVVPASPSVSSPPGACSQYVSRS
jgi:hypothetical protein